MPDEGPEAHEWVEKAADEAQEHEKNPHRRSGNTWAALTAAILAVLAAIGGLLSGHAVNEAILLQSEGVLLQTKAADQWAFYQAKSTKQQLYESSHDVVGALGKSTEPDPGGFLVKAKAYDRDKQEIQKKALELEGEAEGKQQESARKFARHQAYSFGIAAFQVGIVLASVTIMVKNAWSYPGSLLAGVVGLIYLLRGIWPA